MTSPLRSSVFSVVFFDVGGTLIRPRARVGEIYARRAADFGVAADEDAIDASFRAAFAASPPLAFPGASGRELLARERGWWRDVVLRAFAGHAFADFDAFFDCLYEEFAGADAWEVFADVLPVLEALRAAGISLGVVSNFDQRIHRLLNEMRLSRYFGSVTFSSGAGFAKPDPRIFTGALRRHGAAPGEAMHVGDSAREDVEGARAAGLTGLLVRSGGTGLEIVLDAALP